MNLFLKFGALSKYRNTIPEEEIDSGEPTFSQMRTDMTSGHQAVVHGVNPAWSWGSNPRVGVGVSIPTEFTDPHFVPWGVVGTTSGNTATNTRVQIRRVITDVKRNGSWSRFSYDTNGLGDVYGSMYLNFETNVSTPADELEHGADGISVRMPSSGSYHWFSTDRYAISRTNLQEIVVRFEARLILHDSGGTDDRANAKVLAGAGGDLWRTRTASWDPETYSNDDFAIGRFKFVTNNWQAFSASTLTSDVEVNDYLTWIDSTTSPTPSPTPSPTGTKFETFSDDFGGTLSKWTITTESGSGTPSISGGRLQITCPTTTTGYAGVQTPTSYLIKDSYFFARLITAPAGTGVHESSLIIGTSTNQCVGFWILGHGQYAVQTRNGGSNTTHFSGSSSGVVWFRIREASGTTYFETAGSGATNPPSSGNWTVRASITTPSFLNSTVFAKIDAGTWQASSSANTVVWDGVNTSSN